MKAIKALAVTSALLTLVLSLSGCDIFWDLLGGQSDEDAAKVDVSGRWSGATGVVRVEGIPEPTRYLLFAFDGVFEMKSVPLTLQLVQNASAQVSGTVNANAVISVKMNVDGFVTGNQLALEGTVQFFPKTPSYFVQLNGLVNKNKIQGQWTVFEAGQEVKSGSWHARK